MHFRHQQQRPPGEVPPELRAVRRFAHQVELVLEVALEFRDDFQRAQALAVGEQPLDEARRGAQQADVVRDDAGDAGMEDLDGNRTRPPFACGNSAKCTCATDALAAASNSKL